MSDGYYQNGMWRGIPLWQCRYCRANSLVEGQMQKHVLLHSPKTRVSPIVAPDGGPIHVVEEATVQKVVAAPAKKAAPKKRATAKSRSKTTKKKKE